MEETGNIMEKGDRIYDCSRGCEVERSPQGELEVSYSQSCCKLNSFNWLEGIPEVAWRDLYEVRFKNTRKAIYRNTSGQLLTEGDLVVVEAANGHDVGIITLEGPVVIRQLTRHRIDPSAYEFKRIYRKAKILDIERWQEATAREHKTMIRARQLAARLGLNMKIGDVEFQGDGTKAIFYYIADERVDFRQLIKDFAEEFHIRIEMKQIGARQEAGLIGGIGICGRDLCCSRYMSDFKSITTQAARCQDLSLNPQKLAGQCSKLKCCINYEASCYIDARKNIPEVREPLELKDGKAFHIKDDILLGKMYFSYDKDSMANLICLPASRVHEIISLNRKGIKPESLLEETEAAHETEFVSAVGDDSITRFDEQKRKKTKRKSREGRNGEERNEDKRNGEGKSGKGRNSEGRNSEGRNGEGRNGEGRNSEAERQSTENGELTDKGKKRRTDERRRADDEKKGIEKGIEEDGKKPDNGKGGFENAGKVNRRRTDGGKIPEGERQKSEADRTRTEGTEHRSWNRDNRNGEGNHRGHRNHKDDRNSKSSGTAVNADRGKGNDESHIRRDGSRESGSEND